MTAATNPQQGKITRPVGVGAPVAPPERLAPHSVEAEESFLGCILLNPDDLSKVTGQIEPDDFFIIRNRWVYEAILSLAQRHEDIDIVTVVDELDRQGRLADLGGASYVTDIINHTPSSLYIETYAGIMIRAADRRNWREFARDLHQESERESDNIATQFTTMLGRFMRECRPRELNRGLLLSGAIEDRFWTLQSRLEGEHKVFPMPWIGAEDRGLPYATGGKVMVWGGDKKTGKTAGCERLAEHWLSMGMNGFYIHTEQTGDDMILRRYSRWSGVPFLRLETPWKLNEKDILKREDAMTITGAWPGRMEFYRDMPLTPDKAFAAMRRAVDVFNVDFIVLDQFTSLHWGDSGNQRSEATQRYEFVSQIVDFAERTGILILVSTQMINSADGRRAYGTNALNDLAALFLDVESKKLKEPFKYRADGEIHTLRPGSFDPRVDLNPVLARFTSSATIPLFYDGRRLFWRDRSEVEIIEAGD